MQQTLASSIQVSGIGLHSGATTNVRLMPATSSDGRYFVRVDLPNLPIIPAKLEAVKSTTLSTELASGDARVRTVEHLLAALASMGVDHVRIEIDGPEVPLLDGSAKNWHEAIAKVGLTTLDPSPLPSLTLTHPLWIHQDDSFVAAIPAHTTRFTYGIDFEYSEIGNQWYSWSLDSSTFAAAIAPARTFALADQIEQLQQAGLIKGGSLDNALVCSHTGWLNPPLRFTNEPVRHKLLDLVGDLSLLGIFPQAHFLAYKAGHKLHIQLAHRITQSCLLTLLS